VTDINKLRDIVPAWDLLTRNALEPNVFYESWALLPALEHLATPHQSVAVLLIWKDNAHSKLIGLLPVLHEASYYKCPASHWLNWLHLHCPVGTPLIHAEYVEQALQSLFSWLCDNVRATVFSFKHVAIDGEFFRHLNGFLRSQGHSLDATSHWERALLQTEMSGEDYLQVHQRKKKVKEFNRLRRRLEGLGKLEFHTLLPGEMDDLTQWTKDFLLLEARGWKGREKTAMHSRQGEHLFATNLISQAAAHGQLMMLKMTLNGEPIAVKLNFASATQGAFALKIAYNEDYAQYSPGVLLELENIYSVLDKTYLGWMDSCAVPNHPMINHLWAERRKMANLHISTHRLFSKPLLHTMQMVRSVYHHYKGRHS
jgi:CelD/BcsL family acetyltransferase involved in cellulose biosynthesis